MQNSRKSLTYNVVSHVVLTSFLMLFLLGVIVFLQTSSLTKTLIEKELLDQALRISFFLEKNEEGSLDLNLPKRHKDYYSGEDDHHQYAVLNTKGNILSKSQTFDFKNVKHTLDEGGKHYFNYQGKDQKIYTGLKYDYLLKDKIYPIYIIEYEEEFSEFLYGLKQNFLINLFFLAAPLILLQGLFIVFIFRRALYPILKSSKEARNIKYDNLSFRLNENNVHSELLPFIQSVNNGLSRLETSAETQKFFIANAAHELRTPIAILKARIASLKDEKEIFLLNDDLRNINRLISQMLDVSRLDIAESAPKDKINLNQIVRKACEDIGGLFITANKELSLDEQVKNQFIYGNEDILFRAILNLLENALKHTPDKSPVEIIVEKKKIIVRDYGTPVADIYKDKIFEKFEKSPNTINTKGSGLGLAIVKKAAEIHNATINLDTRQDGNDFVLLFT